MSFDYDDLASWGLAVGLILFFIFILTLLTWYSFSAKEFKGYYLHHGGSGYEIWINWENAPDEPAYQSYDGDKIFRIYKELTGKLIEPDASDKQDETK